MPEKSVNADPRTIDPPGVEYRENRDPEHVSRLAQVMREKGFFGSILCRRAAARLQVVWGETRRLAAIQAGLAEVPVQVVDRDLTETDIGLLQWEENEHRRGYSPVEKFRLMHRLKELNGWSNAELARRLKTSAAEVTKSLAILERYPKDLWPLIGEGDGRVPASTAYQFSRLPDDTAIRELTDKVVKGLLSRDAAEEVVAGLLKKPTRRQKPVPARTRRGLSAVLPPLGYDGVLAELAAVAEAVKKCQRLNLPLSAIRNFLRPEDDQAATAAAN